MKKIVPFKKDINLETNIAGINSISLEHNLNKKEDNIITGDFIVSGTYKMTPASTTLDNFEYKLPVNITIDKKYDISNITIDINDFYYEVVNDKILSVNIEVAVDNLEEKKEEVKEVREVMESTVEADVKEETQEEVIKELNEREMPSIFNTVDDTDNYVTYKIHIVTENDTLESIMEEYSTNREILEDYNDLSNIKLGDKIIIACDN